MERLTAYDSDDFAYVKGGKVMDKKFLPRYCVLPPAKIPALNRMKSRIGLTLKVKHQKLGREYYFICQTRKMTFARENIWEMEITELA